MISGEPLKQRVGAFKVPGQKVAHFGRAGMRECHYKNEQKRKRKELHDLMMAWR